MNSSSFRPAFAVRKIVRWAPAIFAAWLGLGLTVLGVEKNEAPQKIPPPFSPGSAVLEKNVAVFEKRFRADTGESERTRRVAIERQIPVKVGAKERLVFKFDLMSWPEPLRPLARLWVAVGAPSAITSEGPLQVNFSQGGVGMTTGIDHTFNIDGVMVMGCDYAVPDGAVTVEIDNSNHLSDVPCSLYAIVYVPKKVDPVDSAKK